MTRAKRDTMVLQIGGKRVGCQPHLRNEKIVVDVPNNERQTGRKKYGHL
jgi:hypothetical protein